MISDTTPRSFSFLGILPTAVLNARDDEIGLLGSLYALDHSAFSSDRKFGERCPSSGR